MLSRRVVKAMYPEECSVYERAPTRGRLAHKTKLRLAAEEGAIVSIDRTLPSVTCLGGTFFPGCFFALGDAHKPDNLVEEAAYKRLPDEVPTTSSCSGSEFENEATFVRHFSTIGELPTFKTSNKHGMARQTSDSSTRVTSVGSNASPCISDSED